MEEIRSYALAAITGLISGFVVCIPVGPINITILNEGAKRGFLWAFMIGLGAMAMDFIYCAIAFAGFTGFFTSPVIRAGMELGSFLLMLFLGIKYLYVRDLPATTKTVEAVEQKLHPHTAFMIGFVRVLGNPAVLLFYITLSASFIAHEWIEDTFASKAVCVAANMVGGTIWFAILAYLVARGHGKFSTATLVRMSHWSGFALLVMAALLGIRIIRLLAR
ncbi:MAG TPA: LysE family transporter [Methylomirabilota bacterium]|nr:LysE family transporter [Methylomirabilota bacterium]